MIQGWSYRVRIALLTCCLVCAHPAFTQERLMLFGIIEDLDTGRPLVNVRVRDHLGDALLDSVFTDASGSYQVFLPLSGAHRITYSAEGFHTKMVLLDLDNEMDSLERSEEWGMRVDVSLLNAVLQMPKEILDAPVGRGGWIAERHAFEWDRSYTDRYMIGFKKALKEAKKK